MIAIFAIVVSGALSGAFIVWADKGVKGRHIVIDNEIVFRGIGARQ